MEAAVSQAKIEEALQTLCGAIKHLHGFMVQTSKTDLPHEAKLSLAWLERDLERSGQLLVQINAAYLEFQKIFELSGQDPGLRQ